MAGRRLVLGALVALSSSFVVFGAACVGSDPAPSGTSPDTDSGLDAQIPATDAASDAAVPTDAGGDVDAGQAFDPATLALTGWWRANYTVAPWRGVTSAGVSATTGDLVIGGSGAPVAGAPQNGFTPADFASGHALSNTALTSTLFTASAATVIGVFKARTLAPPGANIYTDTTIWQDSSGSMGVAVTTAGVTAYQTDSTTRQTLPATYAAGSYAIFMMRWDGANLGLTLNASPELTVGCGNAAILSSSVIVGVDYGNGGGFDGSILELMTIDTTLSDADYANVKRYVDARYQLTL